MPLVKVKCKESRLVGDEKYVAGKDYTMDAERAGKYSEWFSTSSRDDDEAVTKAWGAVQARMAQERKAREALETFDPMILAQAAKLVQDAALKRLAAKEAV